VGHDHDTNGTGGQTPRVLEHVDLGVLASLTVGSRGLGVLDVDVEHLGEVLAKVVRGTALDTTASGGDEALNSGRVVGTGKLLVLRLDTGDDGDGEDLLVNAAVEVENVADLLVGLRLLEKAVWPSCQRNSRVRRKGWGS
jgi:hypothetical protein